MNETENRRNKTWVEAGMIMTSKDQLLSCVDYRIMVVIFVREVIKVI